MEEQLKNLVETINKNIGRDNAIKFLEGIKNCITQNREKLTEKPYKNIEFPDEKITPNLTEEDLRNLKYSEKITEVERNIRYHIEDENTTSTEIKGYTLIKGKKFYLFFHLSREDKRKFFNTSGRDKPFLCKCVITYNPELNRYSIFNLEIYKISEPLKKWRELMEGKSVLERIEILLGILTLNPKNLYYHEKLIPIIRLIPLVVKKTFMVEISKKMLGKTYCYESLGLNLYNTGITRATAFIDERDRTLGDFFYETIAFIIDEFHKVEDKGVINVLQIYMNGGKYIGSIQISRGEKLEKEVSPIILANTKVVIKADEIFINKKGESGKTISVFEKTLLLNSPDGEALISRINLLPNSWGCRGFKPLMKAEKVDYYNIELLKAVIPILRNKEFNVKEFYEKMSMTWESPSIRSSESVEKNFEGLVKLLFPEFIEGISKNEVERHYNELWFLFDRACEMRKTVDNQLKIINPSENSEQTFPALKSKFKSVMFDIEESFFCSPHRIFVEKANGTIKKIPLDIIGVSLNKKEKQILDKKRPQMPNSKSYLVELENNGNLIHDSYYERNILKDIPSSFGITPCRLSRVNYNAEYDLSYNFLIGEIEELDKENLDFITKYSFYDLDN